MCIFVDVPKDPCNPSPCGPNSLCRIVNGIAVCSCQPGQVGNPPTCRPECVVSAECPLIQACLNNKCLDPCPGTCGINAKCQVVNHNPICSCMPSHTGDPFTRCFFNQSKKGIVIILYILTFNIWVIMTPSYSLNISYVSVVTVIKIYVDIEFTKIIWYFYLNVAMGIFSLNEQ